MLERHIVLRKLRNVIVGLSVLIAVAVFLAGFLVTEELGVLMVSWSEYGSRELFLACCQWAFIACVVVSLAWGLYKGLEGTGNFLSRNRQRLPGPLVAIILLLLTPVFVLSIVSVLRGPSTCLTVFR